MPDYGHELEFGVFVPPAAESADAVVELARLADRLGLDLVSAQDHPYQPAFLDVWTLLSVVAARTERVRVFPNVANLPLRPPAVLARAAASLDVLTGGRVELGLGAGAFPDGVAALGGPRRTAAESVAALAEAIAVVRALWTPGPARTVDGEHYRLAGARPGPTPAHDIGIWLGAYKRRMLELTGRLADGWLPSYGYAAPEDLAAMNAVIDKAAADAGRDPGAIRRLYNVSGSFDGDGGWFAGPPAVWAEQLAELALSEGVSGFVLAVGNDTDLRRYAEEVAPAVRAMVAAERAAPPAQPGAATPPDSATSRDNATQSGSAMPSGGATSPGRATDRAAEPGVPRDSGVREVAGVVPGVVPTADDVPRRSTETLWDEAERPTGPAPDPTVRYAPDGRTHARHLIDIHDHLRGELTELLGMVRQVADGSLSAGAARSHLNTLTMRQNNWTLGAYCESYCRVLAVHHTIEDESLFPHLRRRDPRLAPVLDRLESEHHAIAGLLDRIDAALVATLHDPARIDALSAAADLLADALLSHLSYEERELVEPLARLRLPV